MFLNRPVPFRDDILKLVDKRNKYIPFDGIVVIFGGDLRQSLSVISKGTRQEVVHSMINSSYLWNFCEVLTLTKNTRLLNEKNVF